MLDRPIFVSTSCIAAPQLLEGRVSEFLDYGLNHIELGAGVILGKNSLSWINDQRQLFFPFNDNYYSRRGTIIGLAIGQRWRVLPQEKILP